MITFVNKELERRIQLITILLFALMLVLALYFFVWVQTLRNIQELTEASRNSDYQVQLQGLVDERVQ